MRACDYLWAYQKQERIIQSRQQQIEYLKEVAESCTAPIESDRVQSSGISRKVEDTVIRYTDMQRELTQAIEAAQNKKLEILATLERLPINQYDVLYRLYIEGKMLKAVEIELGRSHSWVTATHKCGLKNLQIMLDERNGSCEA